MRKRSILLVGVATAVIGSSSYAQTSIAPFTGQHSESFDEFPSQDVTLFLPNPTPAFGGFGTITTTGSFPALAVYNPPTNPFGNYQPHDGDKFAVTQGTSDAMTFDFTSPIHQFGGYWGQDPLHVVFRNATQVLVGSGDYTPAANTDGTLQWLGWDVASPFTSVVVSPVNDVTITMDALQATVPEPVCLTLVSVGAFVFAGRRRRIGT